MGLPNRSTIVTPVALSRITTALVLGFTLVLAFAGCATMGDVVVPANLDTYDGLAKAIDADADIIIYDVRTPEEFATGHIPGARNIPYDKIQRRVPPWRKNRVIVVYCASGGRSSRAYQTLVDRGFNYVTDFGGIGKWEGDLVE